MPPVLFPHIEGACLRAARVARQRLARGQAGLSLIANTAPLFGVFSYAIGIINSFKGLCGEKSAALAAVNLSLERSRHPDGIQPADRHRRSRAVPRRRSATRSLRHGDASRRDGANEQTELSQRRQVFGLYQEPDGSRLSRSPLNEPLALQGLDHLMDRRR